MVGLKTSAFRLLTSAFCILTSNFPQSPSPKPVSHIPSLHDPYHGSLRQLVDIESISGNESAVGNYSMESFAASATRRSKSPWKATVYNVYATSP